MNRPGSDEVPAAAREVLAPLPDAHLVTDLAGSVRYVNRAAQQLTDGASLGVGVSSLADVVADPSVVPGLLRRWSGTTAFRPGALQLADGRRLRCDGARLPGRDLILVRLRDQHETLTPFQRVNHHLDTANLRELSRRLEESVRELHESNIRLAAANEEVQQYARAVAHDVRTPLFTMQAFARLLEEDGHVDETGTEYLRSILDSSTRLQETTDALLAVARLAPNSPASTTTVDTSVALDQVLADHATELRDVDVRVHAADLLPVAVEPSALRRVLQNLVLNSVRHARVPGRPLNIEVTSRRVGSDVAIRVCDDGVGIGGEDPDTLFELFRRGPGSAAVPGTGIGLAACRKIVAAWGGTIRCEPGPNAGTSFTFTAPAVAGSARSVPT